MSQGDGIDEAVGGVVRVTATAVGQFVEQRARDRAEMARNDAARAADEARRLAAREKGTAAVVVAADVARERAWDSPVRRAGLEEKLSATVPDSDAVAARLHVDRSQATPPEAAVATPSTGTKARPARSGPAQVKQRGRLER